MSSMKRNLAKKIVFLLLITTCFVLPYVAVAQTPPPARDYVMLQPLPNTTTAGSEAVDINKYLPGIFQLAIGLSGALAVIMIIMGGLKYMTSDAISSKKAGADQIRNAVYGLLLALGAYMILYTINPRLVSQQGTTIVQPIEYSPDAWSKFRKGTPVTQPPVTRPENR